MPGLLPPVAKLPVDGAVPPLETTPPDPGAVPPSPIVPPELSTLPPELAPIGRGSFELQAGSDKTKTKRMNPVFLMTFSVGKPWRSARRASKAGKESFRATQLS
jgi:hypothetical protein